VTELTRRDGRVVGAGALRVSAHARAPEDIRAV